MNITDTVTPVQEEQTQEMSFNDLSLASEVISAVKTAGYVTPSKIQQQVIPHILEGRDIIAQAETGSGKTAAFAMPILSTLQKNNKVKHPQVLVLAPTRELAQQVNESFKKYASNMPWIKTACIYGGQGYKDQIRALQSKPQIVIGTPGRVIDHIEKGYLVLDSISKFVLDEADEMLKMGFQEDVEFIASKVPLERQTTLFSATMPPEILHITKKYLKDPVHVRLVSKVLTGKNISQTYWMVPESKKMEALRRLLITTPSDGIIVFVRTKTQAVEVAEKINEFGFLASPLNGDISQSMREKTVARFKQHKFNVLVATDVAARGLDIDRVELVVNFDIPYEPESYVHRIGRTGRAGNKGQAILFVTQRDMSSLKRLERTIKMDIQKGSIPSNEELHVKKIAKIKQDIVKNLSSSKKVKELGFILDQMKEEGLSADDIARTALYLLSGITAQDQMAEKDLIEEQRGDDFNSQRRRRRPRFDRTRSSRSRPSHTFDRDGDRGGRRGRTRSDRRTHSH